MSKVLIRSLLFALLACVAWPGCAGKKGPPSQPPPLAPAAAAAKLETGSAVKPEEPDVKGESFALEKSTADDLGVPTRGQMLSSTAQPAEKMAGQPTYRSKHPLYFTARLGRGDDEQRTLVLDESQGDQKGYDALYVDVDNDEDLSDETPVKGQCRKQEDSFTSGDFPEFQVTLPGKPSLTRTFKASFYHFSEDDPATLILQPTLVYRGEAKIGGQERLLAVVDSNGNGLYNDWAALDPQAPPQAGELAVTYGDWLLIDANGNGHLETRYNDPAPEIFPCSKYTRLGNEYHRLVVSPDGSKVTVAPSTAATGLLQTTSTVQEIILISAEGALTLKGLDQPAAIPVGEYRLLQVKYTYAKDGKKWDLEGRGDDQTQSLVIQEGQTTDLALGPPMKARVTCTAASAQTVELELHLVGQSGELYSAGDLTQNGKRPPAPTFQIVDTQGKAVMKGAFEYG